MSSFLRIVLETSEPSVTMVDKLRLNSKDPAKSLQNIARLFEGAAGAAGYGVNVKVAPNAVRASATATFTDDPAAGGTITINGVAFTARASGAVANEFNIVSGGTAAADAAGNAAALAAAINASTSDLIKNTIKASSALGVVTISCLIPGQIGNLCTLTESMTNLTVSAATLSGGTEDTDVELALGLAAEVSA